MWANQITAHNAGWRFSAYAKASNSAEATMDGTVDRQFRCSAFVHFGTTGAGSVLWPGVPEPERSA
jgi:hypothetical protein